MVHVIVNPRCEWVVAGRNLPARYCRRDRPRPRRHTVSEHSGHGVSHVSHRLLVRCEYARDNAAQRRAICGVGSVTCQ